MRVERRMKEVYAQRLGGPRAVEQFTFERYLSSEVNGAALEAAKAFDHRKHNLYIQGPTGTGKSHLAIAAARKVIKTAQVWVLKLPTFAREIRACKGAIDEHEVIQRYVKADVLVLDDLGVQKDTEFASVILYEIVDGRYMEKPGGLIVTSNLGLDEVGAKLGDDRIPSRLAQMCKFLSLEGEQDRRIGER